MTQKRRSSKQKKSKTLDPVVSDKQVSVEPEDTEERMAPKGISDEETQELKNRSVALVKQLEDASGSTEMELMDSITSVGLQAQRNCAAELGLLKTRVGEMVTEKGPHAQIPEQLADLRLALNQINPHELKGEGFFRRAFRMIPFIGKYTPALRVVERIAIRYEPVSRQVAAIETRLREGRMMLTRDNVEMRKLYEQVEEQQLPIQKNAYLGEMIMQQLDEILERTDDSLKAERIRSALHDVSMRVQDLRTTEEVYVQFFVSIEMTRQNNTRLGQAVERTLSLAVNIVTVGLAIQVALSRQKRVLQATQRTQEFLGNLMVANAAAIKQHTTDIGDIYKNPVIAMDKITQAHNDLMEAMDIADRLKQEGIDTARENIAKLSQMSTELEERSSGLRQRPETEIKSIEA